MYPLFYHSSESILSGHVNLILKEYSIISYRFQTQSQRTFFFDQIFYLRYVFSHLLYVYTDVYENSTSSTTSELPLEFGWYTNSWWHFQPPSQSRFFSANKKTHERLGFFAWNRRWRELFSNRGYDLWLTDYLSLGYFYLIGKLLLKALDFLYCKFIVLHRYELRLLWRLYPKG